ncbi:MAG: GNAT family N-acetyltransferase [Clostridiales bacterium]|nr:GNAT family N-acetyltransferase [Clostridiales bacterium]
MLKTDRLIIREFKNDDFEAVHAYTSNPDNVRYVTWGPYDREGTKAFIDRCIARQNLTPRPSYDLAITLKDTGKLIGSCGIYISDDRMQAVMSWILHMDYWKQGYMAEALKVLLKFGFEELKLHRMYAGCNAENYGSYRVMEKCGMRREAYFIKSKRGRPGIDKEWYDEFMYAILADEWRAGSGTPESEDRMKI